MNLAKSLLAAGVVVPLDGVVPFVGVSVVGVVVPPFITSPTLRVRIRVRALFTSMTFQSLITHVDF